MKIVKGSILGLSMGLVFTMGADKVSAETAYIVKPGDTLGEIAKQHNVTVDKLASINNIKNKNVISVGQRISLEKIDDNSGISKQINKFTKDGVMPVEKKYYNITSKYGERATPMKSGRSFHYGLDIAAYGINDSRIYSVLPGEITAAGYNNGGYGNYVKIKHDNGIETLYAHMIRKPSVSVGEKVNAGDIIGNVGTTGNSTGPHLHLEVIVYGERYNPETFLDNVKEWPSSKPKPSSSKPSEPKPVIPSSSSSSVGGGSVYTVKKGDTLFKIATLSGTTVSELKEINNIGNSNIIYVGQDIITGREVDQVSSSKDNQADNVIKEYKIKRGDSLWKIANSNNMTVRELKALNGLHSDLIFVNDTLLINWNSIWHP